MNWRRVVINILPHDTPLATLRVTLPLFITLYLHVFPQTHRCFKLFLCVFIHIGFVGFTMCLIFLENPRQHRKSLRLVISHYEIVSSQLRSNHCDIHWAFCLSDWDAALLKSEAQWIIAHVVVGGCCNTLSITTTNSCTHSSWWPPSYDQRLYSRCLEQWFEYQGASRTPPSQRCEAHQWYCDGGGRRAF